MDKAALHDKAIATADEMIAQHQKQGELLLDLRRSLIMQKWQPDAFKHGSAKLSFVGATTAPLKTWHAELKLGNGEIRKFPLKEVPPELLDDDLRRRMKLPSYAQGPAARRRY